MMAVYPPIHHDEHLLGVRAVPADYFGKERIVAREEIPGEVDRIAEAYLDILFNGVYDFSLPPPL